MQLRQQQQIRKELETAGLMFGTQSRAAALIIRGEESNQDSPGLDWILTSEKPTTIFDWNRWDFVNEILLMDGMLVPAIGQVPFLDSHNRQSVDDVLGHVKDFSETTAGEYPAKAAIVHTASDDKSVRTRQKIDEGHITDGSVGYEVLKSVWIPEGEEAVVKGRRFVGPVKVSYSWSLKEFSATPIGADVLAKVRLLCSGEHC